MSNTSRSWLPRYLSPVTRRRFLNTAAAGAGAAILVACSGRKTGSLKLDNSATSREPGTVWFAKNDWKLADETKEAVRGGFFRGFRNADLPSHLDPMSEEAAGKPTAPHVYQML